MPLSAIKLELFLKKKNTVLEESKKIIIKYRKKDKRRERLFLEKPERNSPETKICFPPPCPSRSS